MFGKMTALIIGICISLTVIGCETEVVVNTPSTPPPQTTTATPPPSTPTIPPVVNKNPVPTPTPGGPISNNSGIALTLGTINSSPGSSPFEISKLNFDNQSQLNLMTIGGTFTSSDQAEPGVLILYVDGVQIGSGFPLSAMVNNRFEFGNFNLLLAPGTHQVSVTLTSNHGVSDVVQLQIDKIETNLGFDNTSYTMPSIICG